MQESQKEQKQIIEDLYKKVFADASRAMSPTLDLVSSIAGVAGIYAVTQKMAGTFVQGAAMCLGAMNKDNPEPDDVTDDDVLFVGLVAILQAEKKRHDNMLLAMALEMFRSIRGYSYNPPWENQK